MILKDIGQTNSYSYLRWDWVDFGEVESFSICVWKKWPGWSVTVIHPNYMADHNCECRIYAAWLANEAYLREKRNHDSY